MSGEYVTFVDSDDYIKNDYIMNLLNKIREYKADIAIASYCCLEKGEIINNNR